MIISPAYAQITGGGDPGFIGFLPIILMFVLLYFLMIRPQMKRAKETKAMVEALQRTCLSCRTRGTSPGSKASRGWCRPC